jgi:hypothetical protein
MVSNAGARLVPELSAGISVSLVLRYGFTSKSHGLKMTEQRYGISAEKRKRERGGDIYCKKFHFA